VIGSAASQRGRSAFGWFLLSILTTPLLAGIFLLLYPPSRDLPLSVDDNALQESISKGLSIEPQRKRGIGRLIVVLAILSFVIVVIPTIYNMANKSPTTTAEDRAREAEAAEMAARERHADIIEDPHSAAAPTATTNNEAATPAAILPDQADMRGARQKSFFVF
jgi:Na+-transporting methylmalonyl-CoA/oxaloacetate decarboxylase gamma subunit